MSLKNANSTFFPRVSIRTRLTFLYSLAAFLLLTVITLFLYWETLNILHRADYQYLSDEVNTLSQMLQSKHIDMKVLKKDVVEYPSNPGDSLYHYYTRIFDSNNAVLIETPGMDRVLPISSSTKLSTNHADRKKYLWFSSENKKYLLIQAPVKLANHKSGVIQIALDISFQHTLISDRKFVSIAIISSIICSLFLGFFISNRGMRSLYALTDTVKNITSKSLHQRIDPKTLPTELNELGSAFNQMLDRIEASFDRLKQFSSDLAHELRIPINNLIGETEITLSRAHTLEEYEQVLASNLEEYQRISQLIENILFLSRAENPQLEIQKSAINIADEVAMVCEYYQAMADENGITISQQGSAEAVVNPIMFRRMISNLISNALKYTPSNGKITINIAETDSHAVSITISDTGIGIAEEHLPKLFDRFYRVDSARSQQSGGIGLGLAIVKSIVDIHHGLIQVFSEIDLGTRFEITLRKS